MNLKFTCPSCGRHRLEQCFNGPHAVIIEEIEEGGNFEYGEYQSSAMPDRNQCLYCGFVITDPESGAALWDNTEVAEWIKRNCPQEDNNE